MVVIILTLSNDVHSNTFLLLSKVMLDITQIYAAQTHFTISALGTICRVRHLRGEVSAELGKVRCCVDTQLIFLISVHIDPQWVAAFCGWFPVGAGLPLWGFP